MNIGNLIFSMPMVQWYQPLKIVLNHLVEPMWLLLRESVPLAWCYLRTTGCLPGFLFLLYGSREIHAQLVSRADSYGEGVDASGTWALVKSMAFILFALKGGVCFA